MKRDKPVTVEGVEKSQKEKVFKNITESVTVIRSKDDTIHTLYVLDTNKNEIVRENITLARRSDVVSWAYGYARGEYDEP